MCAQLGLKDPAFALLMLIFYFFFSFLKSCLLLQVLTQENLATVLTGVMVPAGAVTQPLLIPISIAGQVAGQQGLAVWTIPTATVAALPGLTAASPTGGIFKPPLAGLQGNGNSPQDCTRPPPPSTTFPARVFAMLDSEPAALPGQEPWSLDLVPQAPSHRAAAPPQDSRPRHHAGPAGLSSFSQLSGTALPLRQTSSCDQPPEKDCKKIPLLVLNLHVSRP